MSTTPTPIPLCEINNYINTNYLNKKNLNDINQFIITQALRHHATDIHIDHIEGQGYLFFRINNILEEIAKFTTDTTHFIVDKFKHSADCHYHKQTNVWSGYSSNPRNKQDPFKLYIIPFTPINSLIIRLHDQTFVTSSLTHMPGIKKKIFIWQMGKVGSTTIFSSLAPHTKKYDWHLVNKAKQSDFRQHNNILHTHSAQPIFNLLHKTNEEFIIISLVRDLLSRNISSVFQSMCEETPGNINFIADAKEFKRFSFKRQSDEIKQKLTVLNTGKELTSWYQELFKSHIYYPDVSRYFIDIYGKPFNHKKGFQTYESKTPRIKMMIVRLEDLNNLAKEIGGFLNIERFKFIHQNKHTTKWYKNIYQRFKHEYKPTNAELENIYNSQFMKYFYTPKDIKKFVKNWS